MQKQHRIIEQFRQIEAKHILSLSADQMRKWLLAMHQQDHGIRKNGKSHNNKKKYIHKIYNKTQFKQHVRDIIPSVISRTLRRNGNSKDNKNIGGSYMGYQEREGKLNFKYSTQLSADQKILKFGKSIQQALIKTHSDDLTCPICLEMLVCPSLTTCGHTFCYQCIDESLLFSHNCPNCRENIRGCEPIICTVLEKLIQFRADLQSSEEQEYRHYMQRVNKFKDWKADRMLNYEKVEKGEMIDIRDTESIWCQGTVTQIFQKYDRIKKMKVTVSVLIHYSRWHKIYNEVIEVPSNRLAPLTYFSTRRDIPHYNLAEEEGNVRGSVITGSMRIEAAQPIQFIRVEESQDEVVSDSFFSDLEEIQDDENLSNLAPEDGEESVQNESRSNRSDRMGIREYVNQIRRNVLLRLAPNFVQRAQAIQIDESVSEISESVVEQVQYSQPVQHISLSEEDRDDEGYFDSPMVDLFKDNQDQINQMFGPDEPSQMLEDCL